MRETDCIDILKNGIDVWNAWRYEHPEMQADLSATDLTNTNLSDADFSHMSLIGTKFNQSDLRGACFDFSNCTRSDFTGATLEEASFLGTDLTAAILDKANLRSAHFSDAKLHITSLRGADLTDCELWLSSITSANLAGAKFSRARINDCVFGNINLAQVEGLNAALHLGPSSVGVDTLLRSNGDIPEAFLRGAGIPDAFITYIHSLLRKPIEFYSCFISYSTSNRRFAERLHADLQNKGVRCWFAPEDLKVGDRTRLAIDESIREYDKLLLILSKHSVSSNWVEKEVETALEQERLQGRTILFPIRLDDTVMKITTGWPADIRRTRNIGDFRRWKQYDTYQQNLARLLRDLKQNS